MKSLKGLISSTGLKGLRGSRVLRLVSVSTKTFSTSSTF
jgi:hypothetical protein